MFFHNQQLPLVFIALFSLLELILLYSIQTFYSCQSHQELFHFLETSSMIGLSCLFVYFILQQLKTSHPNYYLIFFNIYIVSTICFGLYWLIGLTIESRRFFDSFSPQTCSMVVFYSLLMSLMGNYLVCLLLIIYSICVYRTEDEFYTHVSLIH